MNAVDEIQNSCLVYIMFRFEISLHELDCRATFDNKVLVYSNKSHSLRFTLINIYGARCMKLKNLREIIK